MATYYIMVMRDIRANVCTLPEMWPMQQQAVRAFEDRCSSGKADDLVAKHPTDFELLVIGEYEDHTGTILEYKEPDRKQLAVGQRQYNATKIHDKTN